MEAADYPPARRPGTFFWITLVLTVSVVLRYVGVKLGDDAGFFYAWFILSIWAVLFWIYNLPENVSGLRTVGSTLVGIAAILIAYEIGGHLGNL